MIMQVYNTEKKIVYARTKENYYNYVQCGENSKEFSWYNLFLFFLMYICVLLKINDDKQAYLYCVPLTTLQHIEKRVETIELLLLLYYIDGRKCIGSDFLTFAIALMDFCTIHAYRSLKCIFIFLLKQKRIIIKKMHIKYIIL